ncbi:lamin tail domain-containing protein [Nocardioides solisilvae]|uniref:lamin tail domain-containing protein n=1 Tax=Nocardioides solisilvae TaxID=1542435 RepID=UPI000D74363F|nr:lamin tail domain-containing protein [Nocardioides solisilvae]
MRTKHPTAALAAATSAAVLGGLLVGAAPAGAVSYPNVEPVTGGPVLISEIANGGPGASPNANRVSNDDFIEIGNFGSTAVDISGYRVLRCGQTGDLYGPQKVVPAGTVLAPGDTYTVGSATSTNKAVVKRDADYDDTGATLHEFGFGALLETPGNEVLDRVGFYHPSVLSDCGMSDRALARPLDHRLGQSHQRVATTGDVARDFVVAGRTPDAPNATEPAPTPVVDNGVRITEVANESSTATADQYVELTNTTEDPVDVTGWKLYRCGENGTTYLQNGNLAGTIEPGGSYLVAHAGGRYATEADATYPSGMHWRDFGAMVTLPTDEVVDRVGLYANRNSVCTSGSPQDVDANSLQDEAYHRVADTGDNARDFLLATERTPLVASTRQQLTPVDRSGFEHGPVRFSEIAGSGPAGGNDEFVELANYGGQPVNLQGWSLTRCEGTGRGNAGTQVADLGDVTLAPGDVYVAADDNAPAALREAADALWSTGLADYTHGMYLRDPEGRMVDAVGVYETVTYSPCVIGSELRGYAKQDLGESYQRARTTGDNEEDFVVAERTPGTLADVAYVDPTVPLPGETDAVELDTATSPGTPRASARVRGGAYTASVEVTDADGGELDVVVRRAAAAPLDLARARVWGGATTRKVPARLSVAGERRLRDLGSLSVRAEGYGYPFLRFAVPTESVPAEGYEFTFSTTTRARNDVQLLAWDGAAWQVLTHAEADADGGLTLVGELGAEHLVAGELHVLVIDGPRVAGGLVDEIGVTDRAFADPADYDWAFNHMTDTQFLSEGFRDVFRKMVTWVVANADARKIGYSTNTGDIIENWISANSDPVRAHKEFTAARRIHDLLNEAKVPNGVLPGNHDNFWGRDNTLYNEYFGPEVYRDEEWYGAAWRPGDNSAHYDFVTESGVDYLMLSLPYRPTRAQLDWAREVAAAYPQHNVVLLTHSYLDTQGEIEDLDNRVTARGDRVWSEVVAPSDNVFLVLGGHYHGVATKYGDPVTGEQSDAIEIAADTVAVRNVGETHRTVVQMLADYQGYRSTQPAPRGDTLDRDTGFQRLLQFDVDAELMAANAYSPHLDSFDAYTYDEPGMRDPYRYGPEDDEFVAKVDLLVGKQLTATDWALTAASSEVSSGRVAAGTTMPVTLETPAAGERWYARVADGTGRTATSVPVEVSLDAAPVVATTTTLSSTRTSQVLGAEEQDRALLTAEVSATAPVSGTVEMVVGGTVLGTVPVVDGEAALRLAPDLAPGVHPVVARFVPADAEVLAPSESQPVTVTVVAAGQPGQPTTTPPATQPTPPVTPPATTPATPGAKADARARAVLVKRQVRAAQRARLRVRVAADVAADGEVRVVLRSKGRTRRVSAVLVDGRAVLRLPRLARGTWRVQATYRGSDTVARAKARTVRLRVR